MSAKNKKELLKQIDRYNNARDWLAKYKQHNFQKGKNVFVNIPGWYVGKGVVVTDIMCDPSKVSVQLPSGYTWCYSISCVDVLQ